MLAIAQKVQQAQKGTMTSVASFYLALRTCNTRVERALLSGVGIGNDWERGLILNTTSPARRSRDRDHGHKFSAAPLIEEPPLHRRTGPLEPCTIWRSTAAAEAGGLGGHWVLASPLGADAHGRVT